jgi:serine/threonine protein phosphatase 1
MALNPITIERFEWQDSPAESQNQIFAIGDIHGRADLLRALHTEIERRAKPDAVLIHLGDYIDRGPWSIEALTLALDGVSAGRTISLPGNHEQLLVMALTAAPERRTEIVDVWLDNGGRAVARELGCEVPEGDHGAQMRLLETVRGALGQRRIDQLLSLPNHVRFGDFLFVHAGIHPEIPLATFLGHAWQQGVDDEDLDPLWIRWPFLGHEGPIADGITVIHGHTPRNEPEILPHRINLDTRAFDSGRLTMLELSGRRMRIIQTRGPRRRPGTSLLE